MTERLFDERDQELYEQYGKRLYNYFYYLTCDLHQADDLSQDAPSATVTATSPAHTVAPEENGPPKSAQPAETETKPALSKSTEKISASGIYQGQADNNFIEIKIDGQPEESAYMVFMLTGDIKSNFEDMKLNTGDAVKLKYYKNESEQLVLTELSRLEVK